jgi:phosphoglycolate phosphatase-like HAD superfamily hydrolase
MKQTVAIDLDGVLADYSQGFIEVEYIGDPMPGAVEFTQRLAQKYRILIYTSRCSEKMAKRNGRSAEEVKAIVEKWLDKNGFAYSEVYTGNGKPIASAYVDDRAVAVPMNPSPADFEEAVTKVERFCKKHKD